MKIVLCIFLLMILVAVVSAVVPTFTRISPENGPISGGNYVTLIGTGLNNTTQVTFDGIPATNMLIDLNTGLWITAYAPAHATGTVAILIQTPAGIVANASNIYTYEGAPIASFTGTPLFGNVPLTEQFTDNSTNMLTYSSALNKPEYGSGFIIKAISAQSTSTQVTPDSLSPSKEYYGRYPLMHFTKEQMDEMQNQIEVSTKYSAPTNTLAAAQTLATGSKSLLSYLPYTPSERDQGQCGNCWVWASTGALEVDHNVKSGINNRLSIQYLNSKYKSGSGSSWACCGGRLSTFTQWYSTYKTPIPWSNTNAGFRDTSRCCPGEPCKQYATAVPISSISTQPNYQLNSISYSTISTYGVTQATAINNIKSALNSNKAVVYSFWYGNSGWTDFQNFWGFNSETTIFDPTPHNGESQTGGHGILIVGYDDSTDPKNPYWLAVNSWGVTSKRPNDLLRIKMNMNYNSVFYSSGSSYQQHVFEILDSNFAGSSTTSSTIGMYRNGVYYLRNTNTAGKADLAFTYGKTGDIPVSGDWTGQGKDTVGIFRQGMFYLRNSNSAGNADIPAFSFGAANDKPITGKWTNSQGKDTVGIFRQGRFYLASSNSGGGGTVTAFSFGAANDIPIVGDWTGRGYDTVGVFRQGRFYLTSSNSDGGGTVTAFSFGAAGDTPVVWRHDGKDTVGIFRSGTFYLKNTNTAGNADLAFTYGTSGDKPVTGKWV